MGLPTSDMDCGDGGGGAERVEWRVKVVGGAEDTIDHPGHPVSYVNSTEWQAFSDWRMKGRARPIWRRRRLGRSTWAPPADAAGVAPHL